MVNPHNLQTREAARMRVPGSARVSRAGVGIPPTRTSDVCPTGKGASFALVPNLQIGNANVSETPFRRAWIAGRTFDMIRTLFSCTRPPESEIRRQVSSQSGDWERAHFFGRRVSASPRRKFVAAGRRDQHARRVRSPELAIRALCDLFSLNFQNNLNLFWKTR